MRSERVDSSDRFHELTTWLGKAPDCEPAFDSVRFDIPIGFAKAFNANPSQAVADLQAQIPQLCEPCNLGCLLFHWLGLYPRVLTRYLFDSDNLLCPRGFLYFFFRAVNLEYSSVSECARLLLSHLAIPADPAQVDLIIECFAQAYLDANGYLNFSLADVQIVARATIAYSLYKHPDSTMPLATYLKWLVPLNVAQEYKTRLYEEADRYPIPVFMMFTSSLAAPDLRKSGYLIKFAASSLSSRRKRFFVIEGFTLFYYADKSRNNIFGEVDLIGTISEVVKGVKKDPEQLVLRRLDGGAFGWKHVKGQKKKNSRVEFVLSTADGKGLEAWATACNIVAFIAGLAERFGISS
jgi:hypothetical protein